MIPREIRSGRLTVTGHFEGEVLRQIDLPAEVPEDLDSPDLARLMEELRRFPISLEGTSPFHQKVWDRMRAIPWGHALTYREMAEEVGSPKAFRAIGQACGANPLPILIPCHRVLAETGLGGYSGGLAWKEKLLELEAGE